MTLAYNIDIWRDGTRLHTVTANGKVEAENAAFAWLHNYQGQSVDWALKYNGYAFSAPYAVDKLAQANALLGKRIEIPVHYDLWMRGARFGRVTKIGKDGAFVYVRLDHPQVRRPIKLWRLDFDYARVL